MVLAINGLQCPTRCCQHGGVPLGSRSAKRLRTRDAQSGGLCCIMQPPAKLQRASISRRASTCESAEAGSGQATQSDPPARHAEDRLHFTKATVIKSMAASADGSLRTLVIAVEDPVTYIEGRTMERRRTGTRWLDEYEVPGQMVAVKYCSQPKGTEPDCRAPRLFAISSSPYDARRQSADLDATILELLVAADGEESEAHLAQLGPGAPLAISQVLGRGFASLFNSYVGLLSALEEQRDMLMVAWGSQGIAPLRALAQWTPVQAQATANRVSLVYVAESQEGAAYVTEWDELREAGITVTPVYIGERVRQGFSRNGAAPGQDSLQDDLEAALFGGSRGLAAFCSADRRPQELSVFLAGLPAQQLSSLSRRLGIEHVQRERILLCDFF